MDDRIGWEKYFMEMALLARKRSTCVKQQVGAVLVRDNTVLSTGYNGAPRNLPHCTKETCERLNVSSLEESAKCRGVHAEANCVIQASLHNTSTEGSELYTTHFPCTSCLKFLINAGVRKIHYLNDYDMDNEVKMDLLEQSGIEIKKIVL